MTPTVHAPLQVPPGRPVLPWLLLLAVATAWALTGQLWTAVVVLLLAALAAAVHPQPTNRGRVALAVTGLVVLASSALVTPIWLHLGTGTSMIASAAIGAALGVRLAAVTTWGLLLTLVRAPRDWLAAAAAWPRTGLLLAVAFRQVEAVAHDAVRVRRAQRARGLLVGRSAGRARSLLVPVATRSLERADRIGRSLVVAGWGSRRQTALVTTVYQLPHLLLWLAALAGAVAWVVA